MAEIGLHGLNLADRSEWLQMAGKIGPTARDADPVAPLDQGTHNVAANKTRATKDGDQFSASNRCHMLPFRYPRANYA
jgi:hypothetical protein